MKIKKSCLPLVLAVGLSLAATGEAVPQKNFTILCVGDSITQGGKTDREEWTYRLPLQRLLQTSGDRQK